jgi:glycosyltransferase involved in cell wall biosynthesis
MKLTIFYPVTLPISEYGGTERAAVWLIRGLAELGVEVSVICAAGSTIAEARVIGVDPEVVRRPDADIRPLLPPGTDVVLAFQTLHQDPGVPWVRRLAGNSPGGTVRAPNTLYLSANHAARHGSTAYVHNGIDPAEFSFRATKGDYDFFIGRLHSVKGWKWAIEGCKREQRKLVLAGGWRPSLSRYVKFVGKVGGSVKAEWLAGARVLWMPALWHEPFGLTLIEALVSGTPVLGTHYGSLPEVISPDVGWLGDTVDELVAGLPHIAKVDPAACRARVEQYFHYRVMAAGYRRQLEHYVKTGELTAGRLGGT